MYPFLFSVRVLFNPKSLITVTAWNFSGTWSCDAFSFDSCTDHSSRVDCFQSQKNHAYRSHIMSGVTCNLPLRVHSTRLINVGSAWKRKSRNPSYSLKRSVKLNHTSQETVNLALGPTYHENGLRMRLEKNFPRTWCAESQHLSTSPPSNKIDTTSIS